jgi:hypothetical protein
MCDKIEFKKITLEWKRIDDIKKESIDIPKESGVYQIYGDSPTYGTNTLLYIGRSENLYDRIHSGHLGHENSFITRQPNKTIRYAVVDLADLELVESTLIVMQKPSFNSSSIASMDTISEEDAIYIQNHGERGMLNLEITNFYFIKNWNS